MTAPPVPAQVAVSFSLSLELLSYQKLPTDQMPPGVDIQQSASGEKEMVFTQNLLLEYANQTTQVSPGLPCLVRVEPGCSEDSEPRALRNKRSPGSCPRAQPALEGLAHGKMRVLHPYLSLDLKAR